MEIIIDDEKYKIEVTKKIYTKNLYIRVKKGLIISVTTNTFMPNYLINKTINKNIDAIRKMIEIEKSKEIYNSKFYYLGCEYEVNYSSVKDIYFSDNKVYLNKDFNINTWYLKEAKRIFQERFIYWVKAFKYPLPESSLIIRKMKSRWGVCNYRLKKVTLNLELIKKDLNCIDYVIVHELSHYIEANHSKRFWKVVEENYPDYKNVRKKMKEY